MVQAFHMVDVGSKPVTHRVACARGCIVMSREAFLKIRENQLPKGNPIPMAETAGMLAVKRTAEFLPLCHPLSLEKVEFNFEFEEPDSIWVACTVSAHEKTGVEMEALFGVQVALLTIYDLTKPIDPALTITHIHLNTKMGGKKGLWQHPQANFAPPSHEGLIESTHIGGESSFKAFRVAVLTVSDRASQGQYADRSGRLIQDIFKSWGVQWVEAEIVPDEPAAIADKLTHYADGLGVDLVVTTGGTGVSKRDNTPEVVANLSERIVSGVGELLRQQGALHTPYAWLSRSTAGIRGKTLIITLPGSPKAVRESLVALEPLMLHALGQLKA